MPHTISVRDRMAGGGGFGGGLMRGLTHNILQNRQDERLAAQLQGEIEGYQGELPPEMQTVQPMDQPQSGLGSLLSGLGIGGRQGPSIEQLIRQRAKAQKQAQVYRQQMQEATTVLNIISRDHPELKDDAIKQIGDRIRDPLMKQMFLKVVVPSNERKNALEKQKLSAQARLFPDDPQKQLAVEAFGEKALPFVLEKPKEETPPALIQPSAGSPASLVNRRTGQVTPLAGTERPEIVPRPTLERDLDAEADRLGIPSERRFDWKQEQRNKAAGGRAGAIAGERPIESATATALTGLRSVQRMMQNVSDTFKPQFVGKGFQGSTGGATAPIRKFFGSMSDIEVSFRRDLADARDALLRARSGAQINEQEYQRLVKLIPNEISEPSIFLADLASFQRELAQIIQDRTELATTPRKELRSGPKRERTIDLSR